MTAGRVPAALRPRPDPHRPRAGPPRGVPRDPAPARPVTGAARPVAGRAGGRRSQALGLTFPNVARPRRRLRQERRRHRRAGGARASATSRSARSPASRSPATRRRGCSGCPPTARSSTGWASTTTAPRWWPRRAGAPRGRRAPHRADRRPRRQHRQDQGRARGRPGGGAGRLREERAAARAVRRLPRRQRHLAQHPRPAQPAGRRAAASRCSSAVRRRADAVTGDRAGAAAGQDRARPHRRRRAGGRRPRRRDRPRRDHRHQHHDRPRRPAHPGREVDADRRRRAVRRAADRRARSRCCGCCAAGSATTSPWSGSAASPPSRTPGPGSAAGATLLQGYTAFVYEGPLWPPDHPRPRRARPRGPWRPGRPAERSGPMTFGAACAPPWTRAARCAPASTRTPRCSPTGDSPTTSPGLERFALTAVEALAPYVSVVKPQTAFYERFGSRGIAVLERVVAESRAAGALVLLDVKRGDIGSTSQAYADAYLDPASPLASDAITVSPYLGFGSLDPSSRPPARHDAGRLRAGADLQPGGPRGAARDAPPTAAPSPGPMLGPPARPSTPAPTPLGSFGAVVGATIGDAGGGPRDQRPAAGARVRRPGRHRRPTCAGSSAVRPRNVLPSSSRELLRPGPDVRAAARGGAAYQRRAASGRPRLTPSTRPAIAVVPESID